MGFKISPSVAGDLCRHSQSTGGHAEPLYSHGSSPSIEREHQLQDPPAPSPARPAASTVPERGTRLPICALCSPDPRQGRSPGTGSMVWAAPAPVAIVLCLRELHLVPLKLTLPQEPLPPPGTGDAAARAAFHSQPACLWHSLRFASCSHQHPQAVGVFPSCSQRRVRNLHRQISSGRFITSYLLNSP